MRIRHQRLSISLLFAGFLSAGTAHGAPLTLADAVASSLQRAPSQHAAEAMLRAAQANIAVASARPNPSVSYEHENVMGSGRYAGFGGGERTLSVAVPLELGGKRAARRRVAEAEQQSAGLGMAATRADIVQRVTETFVAAVAARRQLALSEETLTLAQRAAHAAQERVGAGKASPIEAQRADVVLINAQVARDKAARSLAVTEADLARLTGRSVEDGTAAGWFDVADASPTPPTAALPLSLRAADAQAAAAAARVAAARSDRVPDVTVTAGMRRYGDTSDKAAVLGISLPLPLFNQGAAALARSQAEYDRARADRDAAAQDASQELAHAQAAVADAEAAAKAANGPAMAAAQEVARIARIGYASGKFPQLELIDAERSLAQTRAAAVDALAAFHVARARLARLQGSIDPIYKD